MQSYLERNNGQVHLAKILDAAGKRQTNLPTLPKYVHPTGQLFLCWSSILGKCTYRECHFCKEGGHPIPTDVTDKFGNQIINVIRKGVITHSGRGGGVASQEVQRGQGQQPGLTTPSCSFEAKGNGVWKLNICIMGTNYNLGGMAVGGYIIA
jgi:hypothetical protein